jgi:hypothetical protein
VVYALNRLSATPGEVALDAQRTGIEIRAEGTAKYRYSLFNI